MRRRYLLVEHVGAGGMGTVWRAWDRHDRRWVAVKVMAHPSAPHDAVALERFVREQGVRVRHRHVVQPTGCAVDRGSGWGLLVMDLVRGGSLEQLLEAHGPLPESYVRVVLEQVLGALVAVHGAGLVHRDVKPANLLLEPTGAGRPWVRLGDFGVAARPGGPRLTVAPGVVRTGGYLPPEQPAGAPPDPGQDVYAAGVVAVQLLTGGAPGQAPPPGGLGELLARLTDPSPHGRPASAAQALHLLHRLGVPSGAPWVGGPRAPDVTDRYDDPAPPHRIRPPRLPAYAWTVPAVFTTAAGVGAMASWLLR